MFQPSLPLVLIKMRKFVLQDGQSPLYTSSFNGNHDVVKTLINAGANINQANKVSRHICSVVEVQLKSWYLSIIFFSTSMFRISFWI